MASAKKETPPLEGRWYHHRGYFTVWVDSVVVNDRGSWVKYWIEANCDNTHAKDADAEEGEALVRRSWYDANILHVAHEDRFRTKFSPKEVKPAKIAIKQFDEHGNLIVLATPTPVIK